MSVQRRVGSRVVYMSVFVPTSACKFEEMPANVLAVMRGAGAHAIQELPAHVVVLGRHGVNACSCFPLCRNDPCSTLLFLSRNGMPTSLF